MSEQERIVKATIKAMCEENVVAKKFDVHMLLASGVALGMVIAGYGNVWMFIGGGLSAALIIINVVRKILQTKDLTNA